jgi:hypothetical protein
LKKSSCVKLSTLIRNPLPGSWHPSTSNGTSDVQADPTDTSSFGPDCLNQLQTIHQKEHLLCLNQQEALMLFGLLQAACRHEPTRQTILSSGDYQQFHRQLSRSLAQSLSS